MAKRKVYVAGEPVKPAERKVTLAYLDKETQENQALFAKAREHNTALRTQIGSQVEELLKTAEVLSKTYGPAPRKKHRK